ncbi:CobW family GTP-binding protein [Roseburia hominis]
MNGSEQTKLYVLTGFLGCGKTTMLLRVLEELKGHRIGIIQNEFGKLGIDGTILKNDEIQMVELNRGSIFCTCLKLNFVNALSEMAAKNFEYLFVESSGIGDPSNVEEILQAAEIVSGKRYDFRGVICLVDAVNFLERLEEEETVYRQVKHCNLAVVTKTDLANESQIAGVRSQIRAINPVCQIKNCVMGDMDYGFLEEDLTIYQWAECEETTNSVETKPKTLFMDFEGEIEKGKLEAFLTELMPDSYRIKGFFRVKGEGWRQIDVVGNRVDYKPAEEFEKSQLVFISKIGTAIIRKIFGAWEEQVGLEMKLRN